jgi:hypothetical protein
MTTIRAKLAAIVLALAAAGGLAALSPAGPAVADTSPPCESPKVIAILVLLDGTREEFCVDPPPPPPPPCVIIIVICLDSSAAEGDDKTTARSAQGTLSDKQNGTYRRVDRQVIETRQHAASPSASGPVPDGQARIPVTAAST